MKNQGTLLFDSLQKELHVEQEVLENWIAQAIKKHLIVRKGNAIQLHFENPKIVSLPQSKIQHDWVSKPLDYSQKASKNYSKGQIAQIARDAFGPDFTIRSEKEVYLPVYVIEVQNTDGTVYTTEWNALTGKRIFRG